MNEEEFTACMAYFAQKWPAFQGRDGMFDVWFEELRELPASEVMAAIKSLSRDGRDFAPNDGQIYRRAIELRGSIVPNAEDAWNEVRDKIARVGTTALLDEGPKLEWSHPAIARIVETMGWRSLCMSEDEMADRAHFFRFYKDIHERFERQALTPPKVHALAGSGPEQIRSGE